MAFVARDSLGAEEDAPRPALDAVLVASWLVEPTDVDETLGCPLAVPVKVSAPVPPE